MSTAATATRLEDVLPTLVHQWTYCSNNTAAQTGCPAPSALGHLMLASRVVSECVLQPTGLPSLVIASLDCNAPSLVECMRRGGMDTSLVQGMLSDSYVSTSGLVRAVRAIHLAARWNALHTMREHGVLDVGATEWWEGGARARVSLDDDVFRELARSMLYGALWRKRWRKEMIKLARGANVCAKSVCTKVLHTNILLTTLLTMASEIYTTTRGPSAAAAPEKPHSPHEGEQGRGDKGDVSGPRRHVDFRMHATHALFSFVGASFSNACIDYGREMGIELVRTLQGQVIESWRVKWNEGNRRMHRRVSTLLDHVYDVLARPYGPPPILVLTLMFIEERDNEEYYDN